MTTLELIRKEALRSLAPPPKIALADWIEDNVYLPSTVSALPGKMRLWAYQRGFCEAIDDPAIERISILKSARIGYTAFLTGTLASFVANQPAPILAVLPTQDDTRDYAVTDIEGTFEASPALRGLLSAENDETGRSTLLSRKFPGGSLKLVAAKSPRNLRRHAAKILIMDEIDAFEVGQEGEPRITDYSWFVFGDPAVTPTLEYSYLASAQGPQMASREGFDVLATEFRVHLDFGCGAVDWRGAYRNIGSADPNGN